MDLPERVGNFTGKWVGASPAEIAILPPDTQIVRREYADLTGDRITQPARLKTLERRLRPAAAGETEDVTAEGPFAGTPDVIRGDGGLCGITG